MSSGTRSSDPARHPRRSLVSEQRSSPRPKKLLDSPCGTRRKSTGNQRHQLLGNSTSHCQGSTRTARSADRITGRNCSRPASLNWRSQGTSRCSQSNLKISTATPLTVLSPRPPSRTMLRSSQRMLGCCAGVAKSGVRTLRHRWLEEFTAELLAFRAGLNAGRPATDRRGKWLPRSLQGGFEAIIGRHQRSRLS